MKRRKQKNAKLRARRRLMRKVKRFRGFATWHAEVWSVARFWVAS